MRKCKSDKETHENTLLIVQCDDIMQSTGQKQLKNKFIRGKTMKKRIKGALTALLMAVTVAFTSVPVEAATTTFTQANQVYDLVCLGYNAGVKGPISITRGTMTKNGTTKEVYLVAMSGTEIVDGQSTGYWTDLLSGFEFDNDYSKNVVSAILANVPANSNLILAGHSLGGMVAQQVAANKQIKNGYNVLNTVTFGSPLIKGFEREGTVKRLGDSNDVIPFASVSSINGGLIWQAVGLNKEDGGYKYASTEAHCESYSRADVWGAYDVTGTKNGGATLSLDMSTMTFFYAPSL